jgi:cbb3-type cytochrome oxidase cytochrome c subunit
MKYGPLVFLAAFFALSMSWSAFVLAPQLQLGSAVQETNAVVKSEMYPQERPGLARQGLQVYRANGCAYCHSQQVQQSDTLVDVVLTDVGTNSSRIADALNTAELGNFNGLGLAAGLPKPILQHKVTLQEANNISTILKNAGAKSELHLVPIGSDIARGWGTRATVAQDFVFDSPVMPGSQRVGPDLANVGVRLPDLNWHLRHLYSPRSTVPGSPMPSYRFLFERRKITGETSRDAIADPDSKDYEIVATPEARALAEYLLSLRAETPLYEAPMTPPPVRTNAPPAATNAPAK